MNLDYVLERLGSGGTIIVRQTGRFESSAATLMANGSNGSNGRASIGAGQPVGAGDFESLVRKPMLPGQDIRPERRCAFLSKVQSVDMRMRLGMRCRLSPTADVPSYTSGAASPRRRHPWSLGAP
jgi:hypothetical protein